MAIIQIDDLAAGGIVTDIPAHELPVNVFSAGTNMRIANDGIERSKGCESVYTLPAIPPYILMPWADIANFYWLYADDTNIFRTDGTDNLLVSRDATAESITSTAAGTGTEIAVTFSPTNSGYSAGDYVHITGYTGSPNLDGVHEIITKTSDTVLVIDIGTVWASTGTGSMTIATPYSANTYPIWSGGIFGGIPIMNHDGLDEPPQSWNSVDTSFQNLPNWPSSSPVWYAKIIRPYKNFLVALYLQEDAVQYPTRLRWSDSADPGTVPTEWIPDPENLAGDKSFSDTTDFLVDCLPLGDINVVYKEDTTHLMQFVGGTYVFAFRRAFSEFGMLAPRCVKHAKGKHIVLTKGDVIAHDTTRWESVITQKLRKELFTTLSTDNYQNCFLREYPDKEEIWICIPENGSNTAACTKAFIWNYFYNSWTVRDLPNAAAIGLGITDLSGAIDFDSLPGTFDEREGAFNFRTYNPSTQGLLLGDIVGTKFHQIDVTNQIDGVDFTSTLERTGLTLADGKTVDPHAIKFVRGIYPKISADPGVTVDIAIGGQAHVGGTQYWSNWINFDPHADVKVNVRQQGKLIGVKFRSSSGGQWKLHSYGLDVDRIGEQ
jgi:hypothetical protein